MPVRQSTQREGSVARLPPPEKACQVIPSGDEPPCTRWSYGENPRLCKAHRSQHVALVLEYKATSTEVERLGRVVAAEPDWRNEAHWNENDIERAIGAREQYVRAIKKEIEGRERHHSRFFAEQDDGHAKWLQMLRTKREESETVLGLLRRCRDALVCEAVEAQHEIEDRSFEGMPAPQRAEAAYRRKAETGRIRKEAESLGRLVEEESRRVAKAQRTESTSRQEVHRQETRNQQEEAQRQRDEETLRKEAAQALKRQRMEQAAAAKTEQLRRAAAAERAAQSQQEDAAARTRPCADHQAAASAPWPSDSEVQPLLGPHTPPAQRPFSSRVYPQFTTNAGPQVNVTRSIRHNVDVERQCATNGHSRDETGRSCLGSWRGAFVLLLLLHASAFIVFVRWIG
ncbi:hypothetical protein BV20DRAFT_712815 [Pilatotrama ljubarskyi]|nr:hypothetical protein BV20DRAFT_712815 [Pilatotrama ljubarskyi]